MSCQYFGGLPPRVALPVANVTDRTVCWIWTGQRRLQPDGSWYRHSRNIRQRYQHAVRMRVNQFV